MPIVVERVEVKERPGPDGPEPDTIMVHLTLRLTELPVEDEAVIVAIDEAVGPGVILPTRGRP